MVFDSFQQPLPIAIAGDVRRNVFSPHAASLKLLERRSNLRPRAAACDYHLVPALSQRFGNSKADAA
jgi:hypothetical protein